jgi:RNA polymerase sigma factor (sigma-70 family)
VFVADAEAGVFLDVLRTDEAERAWRWFLNSYSELIYATIGKFSRDSDDLGDCFLYVCEKLADKRYRRLLSFKPDGAARFSTWLKAVVRNLCLDWLRSKYGRKQMFRSVSSLASLDQEIFRLVFQNGLKLQQCWNELRSSGIVVSFPELEDRAIAIQSVLTSRQIWLLSTANPTATSIDGDSDSDFPIEIREPSLDPEELVLLADIHRSVLKVMDDLADGDRLLLRLRYFQELSLVEIADLVGLKDAQTADRRIRDALEKVRSGLGISKVIAGKSKSVSV